MGDVLSVKEVKCEQKDFIYYASAAVLMAVATQVASADEVALPNAYGY